METGSANVISLMVLFMFFWLGLFVIPGLLLRKAISQVISVFRRNHSFCTETPKTIEELGLAPQNQLNGFFKARDYKPYALQVLIRAGVVRLGEEGKMCLLEDKTSEFLTANRIRE